MGERESNEAILVTGSRNWNNWQVIADALWEACGGEFFVLLHGDCDGADKIAAEIVSAEWHWLCSRGLLRNVAARTMKGLMISSADNQVCAVTVGRSPARSGWLRANCPLCLLSKGSQDKRLSLGLYVPSGFYHCFRCGAVGRTSDDESSRFAAPVEKPAPRKVAPPEDLIPLWCEPGLSARSLAPARSYLLERGLPPSAWKAAALGACLRGMLRNRIIAPVLSDDGTQWLGHVARDWTGTSARKYLNAAGMSDVIYQGAQRLRETDEPLLVVEGVFDALPYLGSAVALLGKPSGAQVRMLAGSRRPLVVVLDGDAVRDSYALVRRLKLRGVTAGWVRLPPEMDPGSIDRSWLLERAASAARKIGALDD